MPSPSSQRTMSTSLAPPAGPQNESSMTPFHVLPESSFTVMTRRSPLTAYPAAGDVRGERYVEVLEAGRRDVVELEMDYREGLAPVPVRLLGDV